MKISTRKYTQKEKVITPERYLHLHPMTKKIVDDVVVSLCIKHFKNSECNTLVKRWVYEEIPLSVGLLTIDLIFRNLQIGKLRPVLKNIRSEMATGSIIG